MTRSSARTFKSGSDWCDFFEAEAKKESERALPIIAVAVLDEGLAALLRGRLLPCPTSDDPLFEGPYAPLATFSTKIDFAFRLGLISAGVAASLHLIRKIRNDFAHDISGCSFSQPGVKNRVRELTRLNNVARPKRRAQFPAGVFGDYQTSVSWLIFWIWHLVDATPSMCPECGHIKHRSSQKRKPAETRA